MNTWFISDTHFGHKNILEYEKEARPFDSVHEMNEHIIDNWNKAVNHKDIVYHLGDFAFGKSNVAIAGRLNGRKKLVLGNHDVYGLEHYANYFEKIYGAFHWKKCVLTHIPVHPDNIRMGSLNIHGHLHSKTIKGNGKPVCNPNYFNVSCERNDLTPIHEDIILARLEEIGP